MLKQEPIAAAMVFALKLGFAFATKDFEVSIAALNALVERQHHVHQMETKTMRGTFSQLFDSKHRLCMVWTSINC